jgi:hypothetical protein
VEGIARLAPVTQANVEWSSLCRKVEWCLLLVSSPQVETFCSPAKGGCLVSAQQQPMRDDMHDHCSAPSDLVQNTDISSTRCFGDIAEMVPVIASLSAQAKDDPSMVRLAPVNLSRTASQCRRRSQPKVEGRKPALFICYGCRKYHADYCKLTRRRCSPRDIHMRLTSTTSTYCAATSRAEHMGTR